MIRRRLISTLSALLISMAIGACGSSGGTSNTTSTGGDTTTASAAATSTSSGSGVASKSADEIVASARKAVQGLEGLRISGLYTVDGTHLRMNLALGLTAGGEGSMAINGLSFNLVYTGQTLYIQPSTAFWTHFANATVARVSHGRWLKVPPTGQFASIKKLLNVQTLFDQLMTSKQGLTVGGQTTVRGQPVIAVNSPKSGTLYVATTGPPYPIRIKKTGTEDALIDFTAFNHGFRVRAPRNALDLSQLQSQISNPPPRRAGRSGSPEA